MFCYYTIWLFLGKERGRLEPSSLLLFQVMLLVLFKRDNLTPVASPRTGKKDWEIETHILIHYETFHHIVKIILKEVKIPGLDIFHNLNFVNEKKTAFYIILSSLLIDLTTRTYWVTPRTFFSFPTIKKLYHRLDWTSLPLLIFAAIFLKR